MSKFKFLLLGGIVSILSIVCFTNAGFVSDDFVSYPNCGYSDNGSINNPCPLDGFQSFTCTSDGSFKFVMVNKVGGNLTQHSPSDTYNCTAGQVFDSSFFEQVLRDYSYPPKPLSNYNGFGFNRVSGAGFSVKYLVSSNKMPVSALTPVISGLSDSISEFIPYVVYVGLGVLGALIGFFAIKWLINRVRRQSFGVFSSRKKK